MKPTQVLLLVFWLFSDSSSLSPHVGLSQREKESSRSKGPYSVPKSSETQNLFSPRMDYDEWTPLGRGDPLKNDPTYDYVPPVLERVHYWMDPSKRTPDPPLPNSGVLVLGSRTESTFTTRPTTPRYQVYQSKESHQADSRIDTSSLLDPFFKLMDMSQFNLNFNSNANNHYKPVPNRVQRPHYQSNKQRTQPPQALQRPPYTMLMPPPPPPPPVRQTNFMTAPTTPGKTQLTTASTPPTSSLPLTTKNSTTMTTIANTENVFKQVAISMPESVELVENETQNEIKATVSPKKPLVKPTIKPTIKTTTEDVSMILPIVTMFGNQKKQASIVSKPQQSSANQVHTNPTTVRPKMKQPLHVLESNDNDVKLPSETMMPPPRETSTFSPIRESETRFSTVRATTMAPPTTMAVTTRINTLTTDPMFKHYKQPSEPIKGPFYLIIQGHSKVKTYGANKNPINSLLTSNEIKYDDDDERKRSQKFERKSRRLSYDPVTLGEYNDVEATDNHEIGYLLTGEDNLESLEETFPKSSGGKSKKRYLGSEYRRKRDLTGRKLLSILPEDCQVKETNSTKPEGKADDNLDLESLIAVNDDYDPVDVASILLKEEGSPGSGFGGLAASLLGRSEEGEEA